MQLNQRTHLFGAVRAFSWTVIASSGQLARHIMWWGQSFPLHLAGSRTGCIRPAAWIRYLPLFEAQPTPTFFIDPLQPGLIPWPLKCVRTIIASESTMCLATNCLFKLAPLGRVT